MNPQAPYQPPPADNTGTKIAILFGGVIALLASNVYFYLQMDNVRTDMSKMRESIVKEVSSLRETSAVTVQSQRRNLDALKDQLAAAQRQQSMAVGQAKIEATRKADDLAARLAAEQAKQEKQRAAVAAEFSEVKQAAAVAETRIGEVKGDVTKVATDVQSTKSELDKTIADLKRTSGDLGVQSGYIATNSKELSALKALGERNYFEFNLKKQKNASRVGNVTIKVNKVDQKRNRYTIEVTADDKKFEKKDKNIFEPVQFYVAAASQPYEIVVNALAKDQITGYLATPKVQQPRK